MRRRRRTTRRLTPILLRLPVLLRALVSARRDLVRVSLRRSSPVGDESVTEVALAGGFTRHLFPVAAVVGGKAGITLEVGVDLGTIGLFTLVGTPYTIKFLWAPVVDALDVPVLSKLLGRRRGWLALSQLMLMAAVLILALSNPLYTPLVIVAGAATAAVLRVV